MQEKIRSSLRDLRKLSSPEAADWIIENYPIGSAGWGDALTLIAHLSWKKADQERLARYYLRRLPFADGRPYEVFASLLPIRKLTSILSLYMPARVEDRNLLYYYIEPVLERHSKNDKDREVAQTFLMELGIK